MATRSGTLDAGVVLYLCQQLGVEATQDLLYHQASLLGISGISGDLAILLTKTDPRAILAVEFFCRRVVEEIGKLVAILGGLKHLIFTAGVGEHLAKVRENIIHQLSPWLGCILNNTANQQHQTCITDAGAVQAWIIPTNEELQIAKICVLKINS